MEEEIDYLEWCSECGEYFEKAEMKEINEKFYCRDCSHRCAECNELLADDENKGFEKSFCSRECYNQWYADMYEEDWKDNRDEY